MSGQRTDTGTNDGSATDTNDRNRTGIIHQRKSEQVTITRKRITRLAPYFGRLIITRRTKQPTVFNRIVFVIRPDTNPTFGRCRIPPCIVSTFTVNTGIAIIQLGPLGIVFNQSSPALAVICPDANIIFCGNRATVGDGIKRRTIRIHIQQQTRIFGLIRC